MAAGGKDAGVPSLPTTLHFGLLDSLIVAIYDTVFYVP